AHNVSDSRGTFSATRDGGGTDGLRATTLRNTVGAGKPLTLQSLTDTWKQRPQLHGQSHVAADSDASRHGSGRPAQFPLQHLHTILARHRQNHVRVFMTAFLDLACPFTDRDYVLPAMCPAQIELVDRVQILCSIWIELRRQLLEEFF